MIQCTCGAKTVSSLIHSSWCDVVTVKLKNGIEQLRIEALQSSDKDFVYIFPSYKPLELIFDKIRYALDGNVLATIYGGDIGQILLTNNVRIMVTKDDSMLSVMKFHGAMVESDAKPMGTKIDLYPNAWIMVVDSNNGEVI